MGNISRDNIEWERITVRCKPETRATLEDIAVKEGCSISVLVNMALEKCYQNAENWLTTRELIENLLRNQSASLTK